MTSNSIIERRFMVTRVWPKDERLTENTPSIEVVDIRTGQIVSSDDLTGVDLGELSRLSNSCDPDEAFKDFSEFSFDDIYKLQEARRMFIEEHSKIGRKGIVGPSKAPKTKRDSKPRVSTTKPKSKKPSAMMSAISARLLMLEQQEKSETSSPSNPEESPNA